MSQCKGKILIGLMALFSFVATPHAGHHEANSKEHDSMHDRPNSVACVDAISCPRAHGIVININRELNKITLRHGEIASIEMPPMTMVFNVTDPRKLDMLKPDDHVLFYVESINGEFVIMEMDKDKH